MTKPASRRRSSIVGRRILTGSRSLIFGLALAAALVGQASAHADMARSDPAEGAVLSESPPAVAVAFTEPMRVTSLKLLDEAGKETPLRPEGATKGAVQQVRAVVPEQLAPGAYRVEWRGASADGHVGGGTLRFRVGPATR